MGLYQRVPSDSPIADDLTAMKSVQRRASDTTAGQMHNSATTLADQLAFLLTQTVTSGVTTAYSSQTASGPTTASETWLGFDSTRDASVAFSTSSTGVVVIEWSAHVYSELSVSDGQGTVNTYVGVEIVGSSAPAQVRSIQAQTGSLSYGGSGGRFANLMQVQLSPNASYVVRTRRGFDHNIPDGVVIHVWDVGTLVSVRKVGM